MVRQKQAIGILGMVFAVAGGIAWFFQEARIPALILWGIAIIIIFKLKRKRRT